MPENPWSLGDDDDDVPTEGMKVHLPVLLIEQLKSIAAIETQARKKRADDKRARGEKAKARVYSLSKLVTEISSRFVLGWCDEYRFDPKSLPKAPDERGGEPSDDVVRAGHSVSVQMEREERKKK